MKALLIAGLPPDQQQLKDRGPARVSVFGAATHEIDSVRALLEYGTYDRYYFFDNQPLGAAGPAPPLPDWASGRAEIIDPTTIGQLASIDHLVMMTGRSLIHTLVPLRAVCGASWPAVGFIHSLANTTTPLMMMGMLVSGVNEADALICSTASGRRVIEQLFAAMAEDNPALPRRVPVELPVIPLAVDCRRAPTARSLARQRLEIPPDAGVLLCLGRFSPVSKCDLAPLVLAFLRQFGGDRPAPILLLAGDDTQHRMADLLRAYCADVGAADLVRIKPDCTQQERADLFGAADVFVAPNDNLQETFGLALVEAMAAGLPVLASDWDGHKELVRQGETGFLSPVYCPSFGDECELTAVGSSFEVRNTFLASTTAVDCDAMMIKARLLLEDDALRRRLGDAGRCWARADFDYTAVVPRWESLWDELAARARARCGPGASPRSPFAYRAQRMFAHYPTRVLTDADLIRVTAAGKEWLDRRTPLGVFEPITRAFPSEELRGIVSRLAERSEPVALGSAVAQLRQAGHGDLAARAYLARLQKYGLLGLIVDIAVS